MLIDSLREHPLNCQCLPELPKIMLRFLIEDKIFSQQEELAEVEKRNKNYPDFMLEDKLLEQNEQYQKGLVTARDLGLKRTSAYSEEVKDSIEVYKELLRQINIIPVCR